MPRSLALCAAAAAALATAAAGEVVVTDRAAGPSARIGLDLFHPSSLAEENELTFNKTIVGAAVAQVHELGFPDPIAWADDVLSVTRDDDLRLCFLKVMGSNDFGDWRRNLILDDDPVVSFHDSRRVHGQGMSGFVQVYANTRHIALDQLRSKCDLASDHVVVAGHSRGGAVAQVFASALFLDAIVPPERLHLVTLGSPRVLATKLSDKVHGKFNQVRLINAKDPVPSLPFRAFGFKHIGTMFCFECGYTSARDAPRLVAFMRATDHYLDRYAAWLRHAIGSE